MGSTGAVAFGVEEGDSLPGAFERTGLGLSIADDRQGDEIRVVHDSPERMHEHVAELSALVDRARCRHGHMAWDAPRCGELAEQVAHAFGVLRDRREALGVAALQIAGRDECGATVPGASEVDHLLARCLDQSRRVRIDERQARTRAPMPQQPWLDVGIGQWLAQQRIGHEVDLADGQVVVRAPPRIEAGELVVGGLGQALDEARVRVRGMNCHDFPHVSVEIHGQSTAAGYRDARSTKMSSTDTRTFISSHDIGGQGSSP